MLQRILSAMINHPRKFLGVYIIIIVIAAFSAVNLQLEPNVDKLISDEGEYNTQARILEQSFHENDAVSVLLELDPETTLRNSTGDINESHVLDYVERLKNIFEESTYVTRTSDFTITDDGRYGQFTLFLFAPNEVNSFKPVLEELNRLLDQAGHPPGIKVSLAGMPFLVDRVGYLLITDNLRTIMLTILLIFSILFFYFGNFKMAVLSVATPIVSLILLAGFMAYTDISVTITLAAVGVLILGLGADYGIHIIVHYDEKLKEGKRPRQAIKESLEELLMPILASFITTLAGFTALLFGVSPTSKDQGIVLGMGITVIFFTTIFLLPILLLIFDRKYKESHNKFFYFIQTNLIKFMKWVTKYPKTIIVIIGVLTVFMFIGMGQVGFSTSDSNWIPEDDPISVSFRQLNYIFGDSDTVSLVFHSTRGDLRDVETVRDIQILEQKLLGIPSIDSVQSPFTDLELEYSSIIEDTLDSREFNKDYTLSTITVVSETFHADYMGNEPVLDEIRELIKENPVYNTNIGMYGDEVRFTEIEASIQRDTGLTSMYSLIFVFVISSILYFSFIVGMVSLIPIIIGVIWAIGLMGYLGVPFTSLSTGIIALVIGVGVDFSIHLVNSLRNEIGKGKGIDKATEATFKTTGWAILLSSMTTFLGFMALSFAELLGTRRLGWSLAISIISVFFVSIMLVPSIMAIQARRAQSKKLKSKTRSRKK